MPDNVARNWELVDLTALPGVACPCGIARRGLADVADYPATLHLTEISTNAKTHYHRRLTELYYILEAGPEAAMELDEERIAVRPGMALLIRPGVRHRAVGRMKVLIYVTPKFDPKDEFEV